MSTHEIKFSGHPYLLSLKAGEGLTVQGHETFRLSDQSGAVAMQLPKALFPTLVVGEQILVAITLIKGEVVATSNIIIPNAKAN